MRRWLLKVRITSWRGEFRNAWWSYDEGLRNVLEVLKSSWNLEVLHTYLDGIPLRLRSFLVFSGFAGVLSHLISLASRGGSGLAFAYGTIPDSFLHVCFGSFLYLSLYLTGSLWEYSGATCFTYLYLYFASLLITGLMDCVLFCGVEGYFLLCLIFILIVAVLFKF